MVDLVRDSRWGRVMESIGGEDPYLGQVFARAMIKAQKDIKTEKTKEMISHKENLDNIIYQRIKKQLIVVLK